MLQYILLLRAGITEPAMSPTASVPDLVTSSMGGAESCPEAEWVQDGIYHILTDINPSLKTPRFRHGLFIYS